MLNYIHIENLAIVSHLTVDLQEGLNILTGETGAGKSIWVDAISLALGYQRADTQMIREQAKRCEITLCFDISQQPTTQQWLAANALDSEDNTECIVRRVISRDGPSRSMINGHPCPLHQVSELAELILMIFGQHHYQSLLKQEGQQQQLDRYGKHEELLQPIKALYQQYQQAEKERKLLTGKLDQRTNELDHLRYQRDELLTLDLKDHEWQQLCDQQQRLSQSEHLIKQLTQVLSLLTENDEVTANTLTHQALNALHEIKIDTLQLNPIREMLNSVAISLQEASRDLRHYLDALEINPEELTTIEQRMSLIYDLARKHRVNPEELIEVQQQLIDKINTLENVDSKLAEIQLRQQTILADYTNIANQLSERRQQAAQILSTQVSDLMQTLGMQGGRFNVALEKISQPITLLGNERVQFLVSTNPGHAPQTMQKIVSGGELSRIHLALQVLTAQKDQTPTLIFDEVDVGIGGKTAAIVGNLLRQLSQHTQILCITHLPQVASCGHHHYKISKLTHNNETQCQIQSLDQQQRIHELARMMSGAQITEQTLAHAKEMLGVA